MKKQSRRTINVFIRALSVWIMCSMLVFQGFAQTRNITGTVTDKQTGEAIIGASVMVVGTTTGAITDIDGRFSLAVPSNATLTVSYVGYTPQRVSVGNQSAITILLSEDEMKLEEVVVVGYGTQKKATLTGSVVAVNNAEITVTKNENVVNMLTGKLPGVRISQRSSAPGDYDTRIDIRGMGDPLFVIDGVPRDKDYFSRMNAEEIENVSVLKDGAAAVYGLRAANGVILVTTKSGTSQDGKVDITYSGNYTLQSFLYVPKGISAADYMTLRNEQRWQSFNESYLVRPAGVFTQEAIDPYLNGKPSYDWMSQVFKDVTPQQQHNLSLDGGSGKLRYYVNLGYQKQDGSYRSGDYYADRWNLRTNVDAQVTNNLKAKISLGAIMTENHRPNGTGWSTYKAAWLMRPDAPFYANDNPLYPNGDEGLLYDGHNMIVETDADYVGYNINRQRRFNGTLSLTYDIPGIKGLSAKGSYDYSLSLPDNTEYKGTYTLYVYNADTEIYKASTKNSPAGVTRSANFDYSTNMQLGLTYNNTFGKHTVGGILLFEENFSTWDNFRAYRELMINSEYLFAGEDKNQSATSDKNGVWDYLSQSVVGQFNYDFGGKYLADFRFRYDGSSKFPSNARWGFFPSLSVGWRISEEGFIKNRFDFLSNLKLRGSYGEMGDDASASHYPPNVVGYNLDGNERGWIYDGVLGGGVSTTGIPNLNLTWYKIKMYNLALDFGILNGKLGGTFEVFRRDRSGLLATSTAVIPGTVGASLPNENLNSDRHFGYEISLEHRNKVSGINYFVSGQLSATKSMRTSWIETPASNSYDKWRNRTSGRYNDIWWGRESGGMFTSYDQIRTANLPQGQGALPGDWWLEDWNGDGVINDNDNHPIASKGLPVFNYGLSSGASWKNFDVSLNFQGSYGVYVRYAEVLTEALAFGGQNTLSWFLDRWRPVNPDADYFNPNTQWISGYYPVTGHDGRRTGTNEIQDASYLRLKTMEIGYTLPKHLLPKLGIKNLRVYVSGYNLLTFTGLHDVDPERPGAEGGASTDYVQFYNYPVNRTFTFGASIKF
jgi:TonB-linked SusC/RagA family outer membrane protein